LLSPQLPSKSIMFPSKDYYRPTQSSVLRQMPRHSIDDVSPSLNGAEDKKLLDEGTLALRWIARSLCRCNAYGVISPGLLPGILVVHCN
jgi:hypothetical protein